MLTRRSLVVAVVATCSAIVIAGSQPIAFAGPKLCARNEECDDRRFCNGEERCAPGDRADVRGCTYGPPPCAGNQFCDEGLQRCLPADCASPAVADRDRDGDRSIRCGGRDCNDNDPRVHSKAVEVCDPAGLDEDCDPCTVAAPNSGDADGDGHVSALCRNAYQGDRPSCSKAVQVDTVQRVVTGTDCDDANPMIVPGSVACVDEKNAKVCAFLGQAKASAQAQDSRIPPMLRHVWRVELCGGDPSARCFAQPNGTGICAR